MIKDEKMIIRSIKYDHYRLKQLQIPTEISLFDYLIGIG